MSDVPPEVKPTLPPVTVRVQSPPITARVRLDLDVFVDPNAPQPQTQGFVEMLAMFAQQAGLWATLAARVAVWGSRYGVDPTEALNASLKHLQAAQKVLDAAGQSIEHGRAPTVGKVVTATQEDVKRLRRLP